MESARDLAPASDWTSLCFAFQRSKDCASFPRIPSEWSSSHRECEAPFASIDGWAWVGPAHALPVDGIYHGPIRLPIPINTEYVGFGNQPIFLRKSFCVF